MAHKIVEQYIKIWDILNSLEYKIIILGKAHF